MPRTKKPAKRIEWPTSGLAKINDACSFLSVSRTTVYELMNDGTMPYKEIGSVRRIPWPWLHAFAACKPTT